MITDNPLWWAMALRLSVSRGPETITYVINTALAIMALESLNEEPQP